MRRLLLSLALLFAPTVALAQGCGPQNPNCIVPTAPVGTSDGRAASTAFVQQAIPAAGKPLTKTDDTNVTVTLGGSPATALVNPASITMGWAGTLAAGRLNANVVQSVVNDTNVTGSIGSQTLTLGWAGTLSVARGGTGIGSGTSGGIPYFSGATSIASSGVLSANNPVIGGGAGVAPSSGTRSGNTTAFVTTTGSLTTNNCVKIDASGNFVDAATTCGGSATIDFQVFTSTGANTWTRPANVTVVYVKVCGAGGGGGGGARNAAGTQTAGGGGGGGGFCTEAILKATDAGASQTVTVGTGGTAGTGATVNGNPGGNGGVGGSTTFGTLLTGTGGGGGGGGSATGTNGASGGGGGGPVTAGTTGGNTGASTGGGSEFWLPTQATATNTLATAGPCAGGSTTASPPTGALTGCPYGGAGGGATSNTNTANTAGIGGNSVGHGPGGGGGAHSTTAPVHATGGNGGRSIGCATAAAGGAPNNGGTNGSAPTFNYLPGCGGGGSGGGSSAGGGNGTASGGGGGGGSGTGINAGNGGTGGNGFGVVISWLRQDRCEAANDDEPDIDQCKAA